MTKTNIPTIPNMSDTNNLRTIPIQFLKNPKLKKFRKTSKKFQFLKFHFFLKFSFWELEKSF